MMIAPLLALAEMFTATDPVQSLCDLQQIREQSFDLRAGAGSLSFKAAMPRKCRYVIFSTHALWDPTTLAHIQVYRDFPSFFSDATVMNHHYGLDVYSDHD